MDFELTTEQRDLSGVVQQLASERRDLDAVTHDPCRVLDTAWHELSDELELGGLLIGESDDGLGAGLLDAAVILEELGAALYGSAFLVAGVAVPLLLSASDSDAARSLLGELARSSKKGVASLDPEAGTELELSDDGGIRVTGNVRSVLALPSADVLVVPASLEGVPGVVAVALGQQPVSLRQVQASDLTRPLVDVELVSAQGDWCPATAEALERARASIAVGAAAELCGVARAAMEMGVAHAKRREQFGQPIGSYQAIKHLSADMLVAVEGARACTSVAAWSLDSGTMDATELAAAALVKAREAAYLCASTNIQIHGAIGYTWEHDAHHYYRRAVSARQSMVARDELTAWLLGTSLGPRASLGVAQ